MGTDGDARAGTTRERTSDGTRDRLRRAAVEVIAERGYDGAGVAEIARRAGLTTGAIYSRYAGKAELLLDAVDAHAHREFDELFEQHRFEGRATDIISTVGGHLVTRRDRGDHASTLLLELLLAARRDPELATSLREVLAGRADRLATLVEEAKLDGQIAADLDTDAVVRFCHAVSLGFVFLEALAVEAPDPRAWEHLIDTLIASLAPTRSTHDRPVPTT